LCHVTLSKTFFIDFLFDTKTDAISYIALSGFNFEF